MKKKGKKGGATLHAHKVQRGMDKSALVPCGITTGCHVDRIGDRAMITWTNLGQPHGIPIGNR